MATSSQYEVVVRGRVGARSQYQLERLEVTSSTGVETRLRGWMPDQAALLGMLGRINALELELVAVTRLD